MNDKKINLLDNWNKNKETYIKNNKEVEDYKYFKKHIEILGKK